MKSCYKFIKHKNLIEKWQRSDNKFNLKKLQVWGNQNLNYGLIKMTEITIFTFQPWKTYSQLCMLLIFKNFFHLNLGLEGIGMYIPVHTNMGPGMYIPGPMCVHTNFCMTAFYLLSLLKTIDEKNCCCCFKCNLILFLRAQKFKNSRKN